MKALSEAKEGLVELMFKGLDHGIGSIQESEGLLIAFSIFGQNEELEIVRFETEKVEDGQIHAQQYLREMEEKPNFAIIAFEGIVTMEENKEFDAIVVEGFEKNDTTGYVLAQRFKRKTAESKFEPIGNAAYLGNCENVLK
ncbi:MAG: hypothetical protein ACI97N_001802 [Cognaticolwellia sp.]|jgi:hypothetical protein